ncbi:hypothetical protein GQ457_06G007740 [Hibiscus cannabinus]
MCISLSFSNKWGADPGLPSLMAGEQALLYASAFNRLHRNTLFSITCFHSLLIFHHRAQFIDVYFVFTLLLLDKTV